MRFNLQCKLDVKGFLDIRKIKGKWVCVRADLELYTISSKGEPTFIGEKEIIGEKTGIKEIDQQINKALLERINADKDIEQMTQSFYGKVKK